MPFEIDVATLGQFHETYGIEYLSAIAKYQQQFTLQPNKKYFITHLIEQLKANNYLNQDDSPRDNKSRQFINKLISVLLNNIDPRIIFNAPQNNNIQYVDRNFPNYHTPKPKSFIKTNKTNGNSQYICKK